MVVTAWAGPPEALSRKPQSSGTSRMSAILAASVASASRAASAARLSLGSMGSPRVFESFPLMQPSKPQARARSDDSKSILKEERKSTKASRRNLNDIGGHHLLQDSTEEQLTEMLLTAVYEQVLSDRAANMVVKMCPEVSWLVQCFIASPPHPSWHEIADGQASLQRRCQTKYETFEMLQGIPLFPLFARLVRLVLHARQDTCHSHVAAAWVRQARDDALKEAARLPQGWSGPHIDCTSGAPYYCFTPAGIFSWTSPNAGLFYFAEVANRLLDTKAFAALSSDRTGTLPAECTALPHIASPRICTLKDMPPFQTTTCQDEDATFDGWTDNVDAPSAEQLRSDHISPSSGDSINTNTKRALLFDLYAEDEDPDDITADRNFDVFTPTTKSATSHSAASYCEHVEDMQHPQSQCYPAPTHTAAVALAEAASALAAAAAAMAGMNPHNPGHAYGPASQITHHAGGASCALSNAAVALQAARGNAVDTSSNLTPETTDMAALAAVVEQQAHEGHCGSTEMHVALQVSSQVPLPTQRPCSASVASAYGKNHASRAWAEGRLGWQRPPIRHVTLHRPPLSTSTAVPDNEETESARVNAMVCDILGLEDLATNSKQQAFASQGACSQQNMLSPGLRVSHAAGGA